MLAMQLSEEEYSRLPVMQRARVICALKLPDWMSSLEIDMSSRKLSMNYQISEESHGYD